MKNSNEVSPKVPEHFAPAEIVLMIKEAAMSWNDDDAASMGAAIAYYTIFSIVPLLIIIMIIMAIAGFFFGADSVQGQVYGQAQSLLGHEGATALQSLVMDASQPASGVLATLIGLVLTLLGASGVFAELKSAMDKIWQTPAEPKQSGFCFLIRRRILTFGVLLAVAFLLIVSLAFSALVSPLQNLFSMPAGGWAFIFEAINFMVSFVLVSALFALIFKLLPRAAIAWGDVIIGALVIAFLFNIGKFLIGLYIGKSALTSGFGAAGSLIGMAIWVYYSAQIFLLGTEFTWVYAKRFGSRKQAPKINNTKTADLRE